MAEIKLTHPETSLTKDQFDAWLHGVAPVRMLSRAEIRSLYGVKVRGGGGTAG